MHFTKENGKTCKKKELCGGMCMYAIGTELQLVPGSSPEVVKELTTNKPADLGCLAQRNESLQTQKSAAALAFSFGIAFLPPRSGISIIQ